MVFLRLSTRHSNTSYPLPKRTKDIITLTAAELNLFEESGMESEETSLTWLNFVLTSSGISSKAIIILLFIHQYLPKMNKFRDFTVQKTKFCALEMDNSFPKNH